MNPSDQEIIDAAVKAQQLKLGGIVVDPTVLNGINVDPNVPVRQKLKIVDGVPVVTSVKTGPLTFWDKFKKYYKGAIAVVGFVLVLLVQLQGIVPEGTSKDWITTAIAGATALAVLLKQNEHWFETPVIPTQG